MLYPVRLSSASPAYGSAIRRPYPQVRSNTFGSIPPAASQPRFAGMQLTPKGVKVLGTVAAALFAWGGTSQGISNLQEGHQLRQAPIVAQQGQVDAARMRLNGDLASAGNDKEDQQLAYWTFGWYLNKAIDVITDAKAFNRFSSLAPHGLSYQAINNTDYILLENFINENKHLSDEAILNLYIDRVLKPYLKAQPSKPGEAGEADVEKLRQTVQGFYAEYKANHEAITAADHAARTSAFMAAIAIAYLAYIGRGPLSALLRPLRGIGTRSRRASQES